MSETIRTEAEKRRRAARIGGPLNLVMIIGGIGLIAAGAGWMTALGAFILLWGWISDAIRGCETLTAEVAEEIEGTLNSAGFADAAAVSGITQMLEDRILDLEAQLQDLRDEQRVDA